MKIPMTRWSENGQDCAAFDTIPTERLTMIAAGLASDGKPRRLPPQEFEDQRRAIAARFIRDRQ